MRNVRKISWLNGPLLLALLALTLLAAGVGCVPVSAGASAQEETIQAEQDTNIRVVGIGEALGQPDEAQVTVGVETFARGVNEATADNEATIEDILMALEEAGIATDDIQTSNYSLWAEQKYGENGPEGIAGYRVSNQVSVVIRDIKMVGDILATVTSAGANSIYGVQFSVADSAALEDEAREKALEDARQRAESLAQLSGLTLGRILAVEETAGQYPEYALGGGFGGGAQEEVSTSISPGQLSYRSQVQVTFSIAD